MARFFGEVGFGQSIEKPEGSGIHVDEISERSYQGDVVRNLRQVQPGEQLNPDIVLSNSISIVADDFAISKFYMIKYVRWSGVRWAVTSVEVRHPRLILSIGSVYNGPTP